MDNDFYKELNKLGLIVKRKKRIIDSVSAHFDKAKVSKSISHSPFSYPNIIDNSELLKHQEDLSTGEFLHDLAQKIVSDEAWTVTQLQNYVSDYKDHVKEQILFGSQNAGQDVGRELVHHLPRLKNMSIAELYCSIASVRYFGFHDPIVSIRPFGHVSIHSEMCPQLPSWNQANADLELMLNIETRWIQGIIDILSPKAVFVREMSVIKNHEYCLDHLYWKNKITNQHQFFDK